MTLWRLLKRHITFLQTSEFTVITPQWVSVSHSPVMNKTSTAKARSMSGSERRHGKKKVYAEVSSGTKNGKCTQLESWECFQTVKQKTGDNYRARQTGVSADFCKGSFWSIIKVDNHLVALSDFILAKLHPCKNSRAESEGRFKLQTRITLHKLIVLKLQCLLYGLQDTSGQRGFQTCFRGDSF